MSTFLQQTVNVLHKTKQSLGSPNSLSTSDTERLEKLFELYTKMISSINGNETLESPS